MICSVSAGLPVGKEGPMVHSGAVVATTVAAGRTRNDVQKRDLVACGAAAGVCTAFSAPIGGILFALEEGASYWAPSLTWRTFFCSMIAFTTLLVLNTIGTTFGKLGFNRLFSFGNFLYEGRESSFAVYELAIFVLIGVLGGLIGAIFNNTNEKITHWRIKNINHSKKRRFVEVLLVSMLVSTISFLLPLLWGQCKALPDDPNFSESEQELVESLVPFRCVAGKEYNEVASLMFTDPGDAIRLLFHMRKHAFSFGALLLFFLSYISLAVLVYGIAVPSGLFVPSLLSGAAFGRLFGNLALRLSPNLAFSNTYALIGAAAVLGGMARMTISLTVILLECTGNEQFVLPLMLTLMTARIVGGVFNEDLYHIHIHLKKGVNFLEAELRSITRHHKYVLRPSLHLLLDFRTKRNLTCLLYPSLIAGHVMSPKVIFVRPVEKVGVIYDILKSSQHTNFPVIDTEDNGVLFGTIGRNALCVLLKYRAFGFPKSESSETGKGMIQNYLKLECDDEKFLPLVQWEVLEKAYPKYPSISEIRVSREDRECLVDLRPYANVAAITVPETASISVRTSRKRGNLARPSCSHNEPCTILRFLFIVAENIPGVPEFGSAVSTGGEPTQPSRRNDHAARSDSGCSRRENDWQGKEVTVGKIVPCFLLLCIWSFSFGESRGGSLPLFS